MKSVDLHLYGLAMMAIISISGPVHAQIDVGTAPTVMIVNSQVNAQTHPQAVITHHKPSTIAPSPQSASEVTPKPMVRIQSPPAAKSADKPRSTIVIEIEEPTQPSVYHHVKRASSQPVSSLFATTSAQRDLPLRDANDKIVQELTIVDPATPVMPVNAYRERRDIPVQTIDTATKNARLTGSIRGLEVDIYQFVAQQGQTVNITYDQRNPAIEVALFHPLMGTRFGPVHVIPETGNYELRIVQTRQDAAKNKTPRHYDIGFSIK